MPSPLAPKPSNRSKSLVRLLALTLVVGLAHAALLGGMPSTLGLGGSNTLETSTSSFATRMIASEPAQVAPTPEAAAPVVKRPPVQKPVAKPASTQSANPTSDTSPDSSPATTTASNAAEPPAPALAAPETTIAANKPANDSATSMDGVQIAAAGKSTEPGKPAVPAAPPPPNTPVLLPPSMRLLYEGKGEEKGYIKYAGDGELLWQQSGTTYSSKLEITALFGLYRRTWTSKGSLDDSGLEPLRFGDKGKGAELATHFQRDKGIVSFSANNPDVPLQAGAQDKLSAFLQLSALMAGAPDRFAPGSSISFQAADAHNAEAWNFKIGAPETLDLPGGATKAIKLSKVATAEYGQNIEVWLAPDMHYLPVRIRITESSGGVIDLLWRKTEKAD